MKWIVAILLLCGAACTATHGIRPAGISNHEWSEVVDVVSHRSGFAITETKRVDDANIEVTIFPTAGPQTNGFCLHFLKVDGHWKEQPVSEEEISVVGRKKTS